MGAKSLKMAQINRDLTQGSISRNLLSFATPVFLSALLQALYGSADAIIVGQFASLSEIIGVTQGSQVMNIITQGISGISTGACILIGQYLGAGKTKDKDETVSTVFTLFILIAAILMVGMQFSNRAIASVLAIDSKAIDGFVSYMRICEFGIVFIFMYNCIAAVLQALGDSKHPLFFVGISCTVNVILDLILVAGLDMGAKGAAYATVFAQFLSVIISIIFLNKGNFSFEFKLNSFKLYKDKASLIIKLGLPYSIQRLLVYISFTAISGLANPYGIAHGSAAGIVAKVNTFATIPFGAFNTGISVIAAQCVGKNNLERAKKTMFNGLLLCLITGTALFAVCQIFPEAVLQIFTSNPEVIEVGVEFLRGYSWEYIFMPFTWSVHALFSACGYTIVPSINGILASVVFRTPLAILFSRKLGMGFGGISFGAAVAVWGAIIPAWTLYFLGIWKKPLIKLKNSEEKADEQKV